MILSLRQIEEIGAATICDFNEFFFHDSTCPPRRGIRATPIDQFATEYLGLSVNFVRLSSDGSICGLTSYADAEYVIEERGLARTIPLSRNQVLLDSSFVEVGQVKKLCGKRRFTLAHECAHQILFQLETEEEKQYRCRDYATRKVYSLRDLKTKEDWNEWQANALGAALLMPQEEVERAMWLFGQCRKLTNYEGRFTHTDKMVLTEFCHALGVSNLPPLSVSARWAISKIVLIENCSIHWRCGREQEYPNIRAFPGDDGENHSCQASDCGAEAEIH